MVQFEYPIEGFFIKSKENLIFDVKGITQPKDRIIAFVRYIPTNSTEKSHKKIYEISERYDYLKKNYRKYLFHDKRGRGLLQAVAKEDIQTIYNPTVKMEQLLEKNPLHLDDLETLAVKLTKLITRTTNIPENSVGISGSILVELQKETSDIDLIVYGMENGLKVYQKMDDIFESNEAMKRYHNSDLEQLWIERGQTKQLDLESFIELERNKKLQGTIDGRDFYIRLVRLPNEYPEQYHQTFIKDLGIIEVEATIASAKDSIFTPCVYTLKDVNLISTTKLCEALPDRIFSLRGRYCELFKDGTRVKIRGKIERVEIRRMKEYYQIVLGAVKDEVFHQS